MEAPFPQMVTCLRAEICRAMLTAGKSQRLGNTEDEGPPDPAQHSTAHPAIGLGSPPSIHTLLTYHLCRRIRACFHQAAKSR